MAIILWYCMGTNNHLGVLCMALTEARKKANKKYFDTHYKQVKLTMPAEEADALTAYCEEHGLTKAGFIRELIKEKIGTADDTE